MHMQSLPQLKNQKLKANNQAVKKAVGFGKNCLAAQYPAPTVANKARGKAGCKTGKAQRP